LLAAAIEQRLADIFPHRMRPVEPDRIEALDLDAAKTAQAFDTEKLPWNLG
jgi:hypothetical protein